MRKSGQHLFADCGGVPRCVTCGCDEDDAYVANEKCTYKAPKTKTKTKWVVVQQDNRTFAVKTRHQNDIWYTAAETYCVPGVMDAKEMAKFIAGALNKRA